MDENNELGDSQNSEQEAQPEQNELDSDLGNDPTEDQTSKLTALEEKNKQLFARVKRAEEELKKTKTARITKDSGEDDSDLRKVVSKLELAEKKREFQYKNDLSPEEADYIFRFAGNEDPSKVLENPFVKAGLDAIRSHKKAENAIPSPSSTSRTVEGKTWGDMTPEERKKNFSSYASTFKK